MTLDATFPRSEPLTGLAGEEFQSRECGVLKDMIDWVIKEMRVEAMVS